MSASANPADAGSSHHLVLTHPDAAIAVPLVLCDAQGRTNAFSYRRRPIPDRALKIYQATQKYADQTPPWTPIDQVDWSGGRGLRDFDLQQNGYYDGSGVNTLRPGEVILGGFQTVTPFAARQATFARDTVWGADLVLSTTTLHSCQFTASITTVGTTVAYLIVTLHGRWTDTLKAYLMNDSANAPTHVGEAVVNVSASRLTGGGAVLLRVEFAKAITAGTKYWLGLQISTLMGAPAGTYRVQRTNVDVLWATGTVVDVDPAPQIAMILTSLGKSGKAHTFEYKGAWFAAMQYGDGTVSKLYVNGDSGRISAATVDTVTISSGLATWAENEAAGSILVLTRGTGYTQPRNFRVILSNTATAGGATTFTLVDAWDVTPVANDECAIVASDKWTEVTGHTWAAGTKVKHVLAANGAVYFSHGCEAADPVITRLTLYNNAGTWTKNWSTVTAPAETGKADELLLAADQNGNHYLALRKSYPSTAQRAPVVDWTAGAGATALVFETAKNIGDVYERITGAETYEEYGNPFILKEGSIHRVVDGWPYKVAIAGLAASKDPRNGRAHCVHEWFLFLSWHNTVFRYYQGELKRIGPDTAQEGYPSPLKAGQFSALVGYPGMLIGAIDAGKYGISTVLAYNGQGWCEMFQGNYGQSIQSLGIQRVPGNAVDRLWIGIGDSLIWMPLSPDPYNHPADDPDSAFAANDYRYFPKGALTTARYYVGRQDISKLFGAIKLVVDGTNSTSVTVECSVDGGDWTELGSILGGESGKLVISNTYNQDGLWIQFRYLLANGLAYDANAETPRLTASVLDVLVNSPVRYACQVQFRIADDDLDIHQQPDPYTAVQKVGALETMVSSPIPASVESIWTFLDGRYMKVDSLVDSPQSVELENGREAHVYSALLTEVDL